MHPALRDELLAAYKYVNNKLLGKGVRLRFTWTLRTFKEQDDLFAIGRTKKGIRVTDARAGFSYHNYGLAFDICILLDKNLDGNFEEVCWDIKHDGDFDGKADWMEVVAYFKSIGWEWGGNFKRIFDPAHFQKTFGYEEIELLNKHNADDDFQEIIDGKTYNWVNL